MQGEITRKFRKWLKEKKMGEKCTRLCKNTGKYIKKVIGRINKMFVIIRNKKEVKIYITTTPIYLFSAPYHNSYIWHKIIPANSVIPVVSYYFRWSEIIYDKRRGFIPKRMLNSIAKPVDISEVTGLFKGSADESSEELSEQKMTG